MVSDERKKTKEEMERDSLLLELETSKFWPAIISLNNESRLYAYQGLASIDPFKDPTTAARLQGTLGGSSILEDKITKLKETREKAAKEQKSEQEVEPAPKKV